MGLLALLGFIAFFIAGMVTPEGRTLWTSWWFILMFILFLMLVGSSKD